MVSTAEDMARWMSMLLQSGQVDGKRVLSPESVRTMLTAPQGMPYAMGWFVSSEGGEPVLSHDGVFSTVFAEAMLLPGTGQGLLMLVNVNSLPHTLLAFPRLRNALRGGITTDVRGSPALSVREIGFGSAILTMFIAIFAVWRLTQFKRHKRPKTGWASLGWRVGIYLIPLAMLCSLPWTIQWASGRAFDFTSLALAMLDFVIPLAAASFLCCMSASLLIARRITARSQIGG